MKQRGGIRAHRDATALLQRLWSDQNNTAMYDGYGAADRRAKNLLAQCLGKEALRQFNEYGGVGVLLDTTEVSLAEGLGWLGQGPRTFLVFSSGAFSKAGVHPLRPPFRGEWSGSGWSWHCVAPVSPGLQLLPLADDVLTLALMLKADPLDWLSTAG